MPLVRRRGQTPAKQRADAVGGEGERLGFMHFYRQWLGLIVIGIGMALLISISALAIIFATSDSRPEMTRLIFAAVVPLVGTWVGTVLAYYFSRENFEAAASQTRATYERGAGLTAATPVTEAMLPIARIAAPPAVPDEASAKALTLEEVLDFLTSRNVGRAPLLTTAGAVVCVVHDFALYRYAADHASAGVTLPDFAGRTVGDLLSDAVAGRAATAFEAVGLSATVGDARAKLAAKADCKDVFVTENGARDGKVAGWLTNSDLARVP